MPTGNQLVTNPKEILLLAKGLLEDIKKIEELNNQLGLDLKQVSQTWLDDSFIEVYDCVNNIHKTLNERKDSIGYIAQQLMVYAQALLKTM